MASDSKTQVPGGDQTRPRVAAPRRVIEGTIIDHGAANYNHDKEEKPSYFVNLQSVDGSQKKVWGVDLQRAIEEGGFKEGDLIRLAQTGVKQVEVEANRRDENGEVIGQETITTNRNGWDAQRIEKFTTPNIALPAAKKGAKGTSASSAQADAVLADDRVDPDDQVPPFKIKFGHGDGEGVQEFPLDATRLQEAKVEAFRQLARMNESVDHLEIHQNGKLICQCSYDYEQGKWSDWTKPRRDVIEAPFTPAQDTVWKAEEARLRAADESRKSGIKPDGGAVKTVEPGQREPHIAFTGTARPAPAGRYGAARILPESERRLINQTAADRAKAATASLASAVKEASAKPTAQAQQASSQRSDRHEHDRHQTARRHDVQRQVRERQGQQ